MSTTNRTEAHARHLKLARAIAAELGNGWTADPGMEEWMLALVREDGARVHVRVGSFRNENRVAFSGTFPKFGDGQPYYARESYKCTVASSRSAATMAGEVQRRLLDAGYEAELVKALAEIARTDAGNVEARAIAATIARVAGGAVQPPRSHGSEIPVSSDLDGVYALRVSPAYSDHGPEVSMELRHVSPSVAAKILELVRSGAVVEAPAPVVAVAPVVVAAPAPVVSDDLAARRSAAARKAVETRRARLAAQAVAS